MIKLNTHTVEERDLGKDVNKHYFEGVQKLINYLESQYFINPSKEVVFTVLMGSTKWEVKESSSYYVSFFIFCRLINVYFSHSNLVAGGRLELPTLRL